MTSREGTFKMSTLTRTTRAISGTVGGAIESAGKTVGCSNVAKAGKAIRTTGAAAVSRDLKSLNIADK